MEVFDTKTKTWAFLPSPGQEIGDSFEHYENVAVEGSIYVQSERKRKTYKLHKGKWRAADLALTMGCATMLPPLCRVIENVVYRYDSGDVTWYDFIDRLWRKVQGLEGKLPHSRNTDNYRLEDYGGKMVFLWEEHGHTKNVQNKTLVWCAEISLERRQRLEICGTSYCLLTSYCLFF
ncbi:unnamed protein product [Eruca vesicaria subsp. sativa]|uniref:FKB95-like N-terminal Kelch domain-containing protein n=1 Tax=Eruca vesicaria subsp. sativa TaxID=29727 RepID=A0ABC8KXN8_ERUVS|nr:unnamed protein product [Eruca vesicaria subsp. sativa]